jgi:AcrR family transcriptional regulator
VLYGFDMAKRLSAEDWVHAGLVALARRGPDALKADVLAKELGVSRGSFYWHFADLGAYHAAVIARWGDTATQAIIREIERTAIGEERLRALLRRAFTADAALEIGMRGWAASDTEVRRQVDLVDRRRLAYVERLMRATGVGRTAARLRAEVIYWAWLGFVLSRRKPPPALLEGVLRELAVLARFGRDVAG